MRYQMFDMDDNLRSYVSRWDVEVAKPLLEWQRLVTEAKLSPEQIDALFGNLENKMSGEKTLAGKGISAAAKGASAVSKLLPSGITAKIHELIKDTKVVRNFDAAYDRAVLKLRTAMGGNDSKIVKYVNWLGKQAKAHPIISGAAIGLIIAATALATGGVTAGIVAALLKTGMELLKGERLSKSLATGIGTGMVGVILGMGVRKLGEWLTNFEIDSQSVPGYTNLSKLTIISDMIGAPMLNVDVYVTPNMHAKVEKLLDMASKAFDQKDYDRAIEIYSKLNNFFSDSTYVDSINKIAQNNEELITAARKNASKAAKIFNDIASGIQGVTSTGIRRSRRSRGSGAQLNEADLKAITGSILNWAKSKAGSAYKQISQKHTTEKLSSAWKKAGSPTDSDAIYALLQNAGIPAEVLTTAYEENNIPAPTKQADSEEPAKKVTVNTGDADLDKTVNEIIATKGTEAAVAYLNDLMSKATSAAPASAPSAKSAAETNEPITVGKEKIMPTDPRYPALKKALAKKPAAGKSAKAAPVDQPSGGDKVKASRQAFQQRAAAARAKNPRPNKPLEELAIDTLCDGLDEDGKLVIEYATGGASAAGGVASIANPFGFAISRTPNLFGYIPASKPKKKRKSKRSRSKSR